MTRKAKNTGHRGDVLGREFVEGGDGATQVMPQVQRIRTQQLPGTDAGQ